MADDISADFWDSFSETELTSSGMELPKDSYTILTDTAVQENEIYITDKTSKETAAGDGDKINMKLTNSYFKNTVENLSARIIPDDGSLLFDRYIISRADRIILINPVTYTKLITSDAYQVSVYYISIEKYRENFIDINNISFNLDANWIKYLNLAVKLKDAVAVIADMAGIVLTPAELKPLFLMLALMEISDTVNEMVRDKEYTNFKSFYDQTKNLTGVICIQGILATSYSPVMVNYTIISLPQKSTYIKGVIVEDLYTVSMINSHNLLYGKTNYNNMIKSANLNGSEDFGFISYINSPDEVINTIKNYYMAAYPILLPWNW
jgi:hypothetical protein